MWLLHTQSYFKKQTNTKLLSAFSLPFGRAATSTKGKHCLAPQCCQARLHRSEVATVCLKLLLSRFESQNLKVKVFTTTPWSQTDGRWILPSIPPSFWHSWPGSLSFLPSVWLEKDNMEVSSFQSVEGDMTNACYVYSLIQLSSNGQTRDAPLAPRAPPTMFMNSFLPALKKKSWTCKKKAQQGWVFFKKKLSHVCFCNVAWEGSAVWVIFSMRRHKLETSTVSFGWSVHMQVWKMEGQGRKTLATHDTHTIVCLLGALSKLDYMHHHYYDYYYYRADVHC